MADQWYYTRQGQRFGPLSCEQMRQMMASGQLQQADLVWTEGMSEWTPAGRVGQLSAPATATAPAAAPAAAPGVNVTVTAAPGTAPESGGLFDGLDLGFTRFVTTVIVRWLWILFLIFAPLGYLVSVVMATLTGGASAMAGAIVGGGVSLVLMTLLVRVWLETVAVLFRIAEYLREMNEAQKKP